MTLAVAWLRSSGGVREMLLATDSRLRSGLKWDAGPKLFVLPRSDAALCFAGETLFAYPMLLQVIHATTVHYRHRTRRFDLYDYKRFVLDVLNQMRASLVEDGVPLEQVAGDQPLFLLAGYSWRRADFALWRLHYNSHFKAFTFTEHQEWEGIDGERKAAFIGDGVQEAKELLRAKLDEGGKREAGGFDFEPFAVLRDIIRGAKYPSVGGPPQLLKIYRHLNTVPFGVYWPTKLQGRPTLLGRELLSFENPELGFMDPDTYVIHRLPHESVEA